MRCTATCADALYALFIMYVYINCFNLRTYYRIACELISVNNNEIDEILMIHVYDTTSL
jgi:hypothetical protein